MFATASESTSTNAPKNIHKSGRVSPMSSSCDDATTTDAVFVVGYDFISSRPI